MDYLLERFDSIPVTKMLRLSQAEIQLRCHRITKELSSAGLSVEVVPVVSLIGGGTAPVSRLPSAALALRHEALSPEALLLALRRLRPPVIARVSEDRVLLDMRTVEPDSDRVLVSLVREIGRSVNNSNVTRDWPD
jgi:L-seryl-tRNA(Ser) seleniumtransferase